MPRRSMPLQHVAQVKPCSRRGWGAVQQNSSGEDVFSPLFEGGVAVPSAQVAVQLLPCAALIDRLTVDVAVVQEWSFHFCFRPSHLCFASSSSAASTAACLSRSSRRRSNPSSCGDVTVARRSAIAGAAKGPMSSTALRMTSEMCLRSPQWASSALASSPIGGSSSRRAT